MEPIKSSEGFTLYSGLWFLYGACIAMLYRLIILKGPGQ